MDSDENTNKWSAREVSGSNYYPGSSCYEDCNTSGTVNKILI